MTELHRDTRILRAGYRDTRETGASLSGPQFSAVYTAPGDPASHALTYGRFHNPTWTAWETALGVLEEGEAIAFSSGMAAVSAVFGVSLKPGDVLVLPSDSRETWGLVVNEAMAAGLPVVVSDAAGCSPDLVHAGQNGFTYPCGDVGSLTDRLEQLVALGSAGRTAFGERSKEIVQAFGIDVVARTTADVAELVVRRARSPRATCRR